MNLSTTLFGSTGVWFIMGAMLVFFMQCGFAMVETGFTRAKNAGNILMKNLMDFCIGAVVFMLVGYSLMGCEAHIGNFIGRPSTIFTLDTTQFANFFFNLMFCATAATIVSGAMAERTKFSAYCVYSALISLFIYPVEAGWVWGSDGWLANLGFIDFAGSAVIHMVGGVTALVGVIFLGARIGKYTRDENGKITKVNAIPGHNIPLGALGVFILWFGWYGFNGAAAADEHELALISINTTVAPALATVVCLALTWMVNKKPDVSMCLNASLAGLVAITAGCAAVDPWASAVIGIVAGCLVAGATWFIDNKLHLDDPVGAIAVHGANGIWGTLAVGLFARDTGLFTGGGAYQLGVQTLGIVTIIAWTAILTTGVFAAIKYLPKVFGWVKKGNGLRAAIDHELSGLDVSEHGLAAAYTDFVSATPAFGQRGIPADLSGISETELSAPESERYTKISIICNQDKFTSLRETMEEIGVQGMTVLSVMGCGVQKGKSAQYRGVEMPINLLPKVQVDIVVSKVSPGLVVAAAQKVLNTGNVGDGKIFVSAVENVMRVRTGEKGMAALDNEQKKENRYGKA